MSGTFELSPLQGGYFGGGSGESPVTVSTSTTKYAGTRKGDLTNVDTYGDTWGKIIPTSWGNVRVGGALIWASKYYTLVETFKTTTQIKSPSSDFDIGGTKVISGATNSNNVSTILTTEEQSLIGIDLAYSFGFEGDPRVRRVLKKLRINGTVVYDKDTDFVFDNIGFSVRYAREDGVIEPIMADNEATGIYFYPGQTYIVFEALRTKEWGNAIPSAVDAEFAIVAGGAEAPADYNERPHVVITDNDVIRREGVTVVPNYKNKTAYYVNTFDLMIYPLGLDDGEVKTPIPITGPGLAEWRDVRGGGMYLPKNLSALLPGINALVFLSNSTYGLFVLDLTAGLVYNCAPALPGGYGVRTVAAYWDENNVGKVFVGVTNNGGAVPLQSVIVTRSGSGLALSVNSVPTPWDDAAPDTPRPVEPYQAASTDGFPEIKVCSIYRSNEELWVYNAGAFQKINILPEHTAGAPGGYRGAICYNGSIYTLFGTQTQKLIRYSYITGEFISSVDMEYTLFDIKQGGAGNFSNAVNGIYGAVTGGRAFVFNFVTGDIVTFSIPNKGGANYPCYWDSTTLYFYYSNSELGLDGQIVPAIGQFGYGGASGSMGLGLFEFIQSLYVGTRKYAYGDITQDGSITEVIIGALIVTKQPLNDLVDKICTAYRIRKVYQGNGVLLYRNNFVTGDLDIAAVVPIAELALLNEDPDRPISLETKRGDIGSTAGTVELKFLDAAAEYVENAVQWSKNEKSSNAAVESYGLPIVMERSTALKLVQNFLDGGGARVVTHRFRLPPKYYYLGSGDIIQIKHNTFKDTMQITVDDVNGDFSVSCEAEGVAVETRAEIEPPVFPDTGVGGGRNSVSAVGYIIDAPMPSAAGADTAGYFDVGFGIGPVNNTGEWAGGYLGRRFGTGVWNSLPSIVTKARLPVWVAKSIPADLFWQRDPTPLTVLNVSGEFDVNQAATHAQLIADETRNFAYFGAPGRWELIQFETIEDGQLIGAIRGLRGTEVFAGLHEMNDVIVMPVDGFFSEKRPLSDIGVATTYKAVGSGLTFAGVTAETPFTAEGLSLKPFAPVGVYVTRAGGGTRTIHWQRRDRKGTGWGAADLPMSEATEAYRVEILDDAGAILRTLNATETSVVYGNAAQATDGTTGAITLTLRVAQIGATGPGFSRVVTVDAP